MTANGIGNERAGNARRAGGLASLLLAAAGLLGPLHAAAQPQGGSEAAEAAETGSEAAEAEPTPRYRVEFILFAHADASGAAERLETASPAETDWSTPVERRWPFGVEPERGAFGEPVFGDRPTSSAGGASNAADRAAAEEPASAEDTAEPGPSAPAAPGPGSPDSTASPGVSADLEGADSTETPEDAIELFGPPSFRARASDGPGFEPLPEEALSLMDTRRRLERLDAYRVLAHAGWEQDARSEQQARPLDLAELGIANPTGSLTLYVSRYMHLVANLRYRTDALDRSSDAAGRSRDAAGRASDAAGRASRGFGVAPIRTPPSYVLDAQRRVTSTGELHYVDHPLIGVIFVITEAPEETPEDGETDDGELDPAA